MGELSYIQKYFICVVNKKGNIPILKGMSVAGCLVVGGITELITRDCVIWNEKNQISIGKSFDNNLTYLKPIYKAIAHFKEPVEVIYIMDLYASTLRLPGNHHKDSLNDLISTIGASLVEEGYVRELPNKGLFRKKTKYGSKSEIVTRVVEELYKAFFEDNMITDEMLCLAALLDKSDMIHKYFGVAETTWIKKCIEEVRKSEKYAPIKKLLDYIDKIPKMVSGLDWGGA